LTDRELTHHDLSYDRVLREVMRRGVVSSAMLQAATGLSRSRIGALVNGLRDAGLLDAHTQGHMGRRLSITMKPELASLVGIDLTLDRASVAVGDLGYGLLNDPRTATVSVPIDDCDATLDRIAELVATEVEVCAMDCPLMGVGLGLPGPVQRESGSPQSDYLLPNWQNVPVTERLSKRLEAHGVVDPNVRVVNDASLGALGVITRAKWANPMKAPEDLVYIRVSRGIGMGLIIKGNLVTGARGFAGEIGHVRVQADGPICPRCYRKGCLEVLASETAVLEVLRHHARAENRPGPAGVEELGQTSDEATHRELMRAGWNLGFVLAAVANVLNPTWIVLGGAMPEMKSFRSGLTETLHKYALPQAVEGLRVVTWNRLFDDQNFKLVGQDVGAGLSPEIVGALAIVVAEFGADFLRPHITGSVNEA
jgi:predicted NBD/HSP70 family sugar kinase